VVVSSSHGITIVFLRRLDAYKAGKQENSDIFYHFLSHSIRPICHRSDAVSADRGLGYANADFPLYMIAQKVLIDDETPIHLKSTGQMLGMALFNGVPTFITPLLAGILVNSWDMT
jgi:hypothetical protein